MTYPNEEWRPFTSFRLGPFPPRSTSITRMAVVVEKQAYQRLVPHSEQGEGFLMLGAEEALRTIKAAQRDEEWPAAGPNYNLAAHKVYRDFFSAHIKQRVIAPRRSQIIVLQPTPESGNDLILVAPTSSEVIPRTIRDEAAFQIAKWFDASSQDFRLLLSFKPNASRRSRREFYERVSSR